MPGNADLRAQYEKCGADVVAALAKADGLCKAVGCRGTRRQLNTNNNNDYCGTGHVDTNTNKDVCGDASALLVR